MTARRISSNGPRLLQFLVDAGVVPAGADVGVHLGAQTLADRQGGAAGAPGVVADDGGAVSDALAQQLRVDSLGGGRLPYEIGKDALAGEFELGHGNLCVFK
jgi:hypothetical protein